MLRRFFVIAAVVCAAAAALYSQPFAAQESGSITGRVVDPSGAPVAGLEVVLVPRAPQPPRGLPESIEKRGANPEGVIGLIGAPLPERPGTRRTTSDASGAFTFDALPNDRAFQLHTRPGAHVVAASMDGRPCVAGDTMALVAHELVDVPIEFVSVPGAPTANVLVQFEAILATDERGSGSLFASTQFVDAPGTVLRVPRGRGTLTAMSWTGSNENKGAGGFEWRWQGQLDTAQAAPVVVKLAPRRTVDVFVRNSPFGTDERYGARVLLVRADGSQVHAPDDPPNSGRPSRDGLFTLVVPGTEFTATSPLVVRVASPRERVLAEVPLELDAPRGAVRIDLAGLESPRIVVDVVVPAGHTREGLTLGASDGHRRLDDVTSTTLADGRYRIDSVPLSDVVLSGRAAQSGARIFVTHPLLGVRSIAVENEVFEYRVEYEEMSAVRLRLVGDEARAVLATATLVAGPIDPVDGYAPHFTIEPEDRRASRAPETASLFLSDLQPGRWRFALVLGAVDEYGAPSGSGGAVAVLETDVTSGVHEYELRLPRRYSASLWFPRSRPHVGVAVVSGQGLRVALPTDAEGRVRFDGLLAGHYGVWSHDSPNTPREFEIVVPCEEVVWAGRPHDALRVAIASADSPLAAAGLANGDLLIGFDGITLRQQKDWATGRRVVREFELFGDSFDGPRILPPYSAVELGQLLFERSMKLRVLRGDAVIDVEVGPLPPLAADEPESLGATLTPVYRE